MIRPCLVVCALAIAACRGPRAPTTPARSGVEAYVAALRRDDPRAAYALLSESARNRVRYDDFALAWKQSAAERKWQVAALERTLQGNPNVGERALITFTDGKIVQLERDDKTWLLESELVSRSRAKRPRDAIRLFADAIAHRDVAAALGVLTQRRRDGLQKQVEGFVAGIGKHVTGPIDEFPDRAELRWDENGIRYKIVLRKEEDEWRVDDIYIRPAPKDAEDAEPDADDEE